MALTTNSLVDGEWVTRTLDLNTVLRHYDQQDKDAAAAFTEVERAPKLGLLTQTVIRSPLVHWVLPIRLRDDKTHDVAFVGDDFVQIKELRSDGLLWDVIRKEDFGARIRNALVVGSVKAYEKDPDVLAFTKIKTEDGDEDAQMTGGETVPSSLSGNRLPPQFLLLQLDTGDLGFLMLNRSENGKLDFVSTRYRVSKPMLRLQPGMHLAVDPSSRYMAVGCSEGVFAIYSLQSRETLQEQYLEGSPLRFVESETQHYFNGVILKMEFLHPAADDEEHIILLVLMVIKGRTRMLLYEWATGSDLKKVTPRSSKGYLLEKARQMPLLLIPLTIKSSFILVYEDSMAVCQGILHGNPKFIDFNNRIDKPTAFHHGSENPLWTAWTRPSRLERHKATRDDLFIAREDGLIKFLEIDSEDDDVVTADHNIGEFEANCGTALATLDYPNKNRKSGDLFIMGGDSCPGGTYLLQARKLPVLTEPIQNWSPAHDFVTTHNPRVQNPSSNAAGLMRKTDIVPKPDRIFTCVGKGARGGITELRHGHEASIGLEVEYDATIMYAWALSPNPDRTNPTTPYLFLLSMGDRSGALKMSADAVEIVDLDESETNLDLGHRTILAVTRGNFIVQVTEKSIVVTDGSTNHIYQVHEMLKVHSKEAVCESKIDHATVSESFVLFTTRLEDVDNFSYLQVLDLQFLTSDMEIDSATPHTIGQLPYDVTSISAGQIGGALFAVVASGRKPDPITLTFQPTTGSLLTQSVLTHRYENNLDCIDSIVSMSLLPTEVGLDVVLLICGTRNGFVVVFEINKTTFAIVPTHVKLIGATSAIVSKSESSDLGSALFVDCDSKGYVLTPRISQTRGVISGRYTQALEINQIWLTDALRPGLQQPTVTSLASMRPLTGGTCGSLLVISGSRLLITGLSAQVKPVTRHLAVGGTPNRLMYSHDLDVLVVAATVGGKSTILFIDPDSGDDISRPLEEKTKDPVDFIPGLGNFNEKIFRLFEWSYTKDSRTWKFVIVSTSTGRLLIISIHEENQTLAASLPKGATSKRRICYSIRHIFKHHEPVYSATGLPDGLLWGAGRKLFYDVLDVGKKKFRRVAECDLPSPAINLSYENGTIYALTSCHSLEIFKLLSDTAGGFQLERTHGDQLARDSLHHLAVSSSSQPTIHLVSDKLSSVAGLWSTYNTKADTLEPVFEAALPFSILRFRFAQCRPVWDPIWKQRQTPMRYGSQPQTLPNFDVDDREVLGLSISGSLSHFAILEFKTWRLLRFIVDLCLRSSEICEFTYKDDPMPVDTTTEPKVMMHIDGDLLKKCVNNRALDKLLLLESETEESKRLLKRFVALLQDVHNGSLEKDATPSAYIGQAYSDMEYYLRPVV
ncbi:uncharacterized protein L3040_001834 [Drepanopeziza brunnea f. sp. 'multigermtubi']|uniref:uncharacterized protein n=1 Tax=Drepanopeziza brunnea f. sp. 'multigermtubi' TaxID=698441 RepID=UPI00239EAB81|nr:hypothetical protein L3040_001834 [Drepanopeziza brunnea f. sp. 'multigermtubi']